MTNQTTATERRRDSIGREPESELPPQQVWVGLAFAFTMLYLSLHLYWALGGTWGLPLLALQDASAVRSANWVVCAIMPVGAVFVLALNRSFGSRFPSWALLVPIWAGAVVCVSHALFGFATKALYLAGVHSAVSFPVVPGVGAATAAARNHLSALQDLLVFEPCSLVQGALLALAGWQFIRTPTGRRRWWRSLIIGVLAIDVFRALLSIAGMHLAIS